MRNDPKAKKDRAHDDIQAAREGGWLEEGATEGTACP